MKFDTKLKTLEKYSRDRSIYKIKPSAVATPKTEKEIVRILKFAKDHHMPVTARGGGTGLSGASIGSGIIIDFSKYFNKILKIGPTTITQPGVIIKELRTKVLHEGYMLPASPLYEESAIGGNVNTNSIGPRSLKYGRTNKQLKSLRAVLADGRILDTSKKIPKDIEEKIKVLKKKLKENKPLIQYLKSRPFAAGGYNLLALLDHKNTKDIITHLLAGSVGTLALITEIRMSLPKYKPLSNIYLIHYKDYDTLQESANKLLRLNPVSMQYMDKQVIDLWDKEYRHEHTAASLIVAFEDPVDIDKSTSKALNIKNIPLKQQPRLWKVRAAALGKIEEQARSIGMQAPSGIDDTSINPKDLAKVIKEVKEYAKENRVPITSFGHLGVGSIHLRPFIDMRRNPQRLDTVGRDIFEIVKKYNGTLVGEHNSGRCRSRYLEMESKGMYGYMKAIKKIFDPDNILNPKVMFDLEPLTRHIRARA